MVPPTTVILIIAVISVIFFLVNRHTRRREAERAEEYRKAAALRGWQLEFDHVEYRYKGTTEGVPWVLTFGHYRSHDRNRRPLVWQTGSVRMENGALIVWPNLGQGMDAIKTPGVPQFVLDLAMRPVASALGVPSADGSILAQATATADAPPGFFLRATDAAPLQRWLSGGAYDALAAESGSLGNEENPRHLIIAVLWRHGLQIATPYGANDFEHMDKVVRFGARLAKAYGG